MFQLVGFLAIIGLFAYVLTKITHAFGQEKIDTKAELRKDLLDE